MIFMKKILSILCVCAVAVSATAVPARRDGLLRTTADGTEKTVFLHGNETFHYMTDAEGNWLDEETLLPISAEQKTARLEHGKARVQARRVQQETGTDRLLAPRGAVILVSYADKAFSQTNADMTAWAMGDEYTYNGATGSIRRYFLDQSWGQYDMQIDVIGPVTVSKNASYYGANDSRGGDKHPDELVVEACRLAANAGADFSQYDSNNDGEVDWVVILYAGKGEADGGAANTIWPHQYDLSYTNMEFELHGKTVNHYCCLNEIDGISGKRCGIGTFCHEFSHVMGLPDFYATNESTHHTLSDWDLMDYGPYNNDGNTPPCYSAYERWFMGWINPLLINDASCSVILPPLSDCRSACYMNAQGKAITNILNPEPATFYIFENRQQEGWDYYLPSAGLLITKIAFSAYKWTNNTVNNNSSSMGVDIIEAQKNTGKLGKDTDVYPQGATSFSQLTEYQVSNIEMADRIITFDVNGGGKNINLDVKNVEEDNVPCTKVLRDGQVIIVRGGVTYDLMGRKL